MLSHIEVLSALTVSMIHADTDQLFTLSYQLSCSRTVSRGITQATDHVRVLLFLPKGVPRAPIYATSAPRLSPASGCHSEGPVRAIWKPDQISVSSVQPARVM